ncbi:MAG: collagen-like protein, partial [Proteobacteria bacterium]|nr:collagen-like protein [Pseudomonadota bacterium]
MAKATSKKSVEEQTTPAEAAPIITYKGFDKDLKCRDFQYEIGKAYENKRGASACNYGFHACEHPLNVFDYYAPAGSRFASVWQSGELSRHDSDTKVASSKITIKAEIGIPGLVKAAVEYVTSRCNPVDQGAASSTGYQGAASSTGDQGAASSTGYQGAASSTGNRGAASSTGNRGAASSTGYQGAASSTGDQGAASSTG